MATRWHLDGDTMASRWRLGGNSMASRCELCVHSNVRTMNPSGFLINFLGISNNIVPIAFVLNRVSSLLPFCSYSVSVKFPLNAKEIPYSKFSCDSIPLSTVSSRKLPNYLSELVGELRVTIFHRNRHHLFAVRPWGRYKSLRLSKRFRVHGKVHKPF